MGPLFKAVSKFACDKQLDIIVRIKIFSWPKVFPVPGHNQAIGTALSPDKKNLTWRNVSVVCRERTLPTCILAIGMVFPASLILEFPLFCINCWFRLFGQTNQQIKNITFGLWKLIIGSFTIVMIGIGNDHTGWLWCDYLWHFRDEALTKIWKQWMKPYYLLEFCYLTWNPTKSV